MHKIKKLFPLTVHAKNGRNTAMLAVLYVVLDIVLEILLALLGYGGAPAGLLTVLIGLVHVYFLLAIVLAVAALIEEKNGGK